MATILYVRVSTEDQNTARQEAIAGTRKIDKMFIDKASGKNTDRPELKRMLEYVREGDTVVVESISRFARNTRDLLELVDLLKKKGVDFVSQKEALDTATDTGRFMLTIFGAVSELERSYILQRQREGIELAKQRGKYAGRKRIENPDFPRVYRRWKAGELTAVAAMRQLSMKPNTFYRRAKEYEEKTQQ